MQGDKDHLVSIAISGCTHFSGNHWWKPNAEQGSTGKDDFIPKPAMHPREKVDELEDGRIIQSGAKQ
jgi:hypothetical protein